MTEKGNENEKGNQTAEGRITQQAITAKKGKPSKLNVLVYPAQGGHPYSVDVVPDGNTFTLKGSDLTYHISPGSVYIEKGEARTTVNSENPQTVNIHSLTGSDVMHPKILNGIVMNNYIMQVQKFAKTPKPWQQLRTISLMVISLLAGLMAFWLIREIGSGFEAIEEAIKNIRVLVENGGSAAGGGGAESSSHQDIAPGEV